MTIQFPDDLATSQDDAALHTGDDGGAPLLAPDTGLGPMQAGGTFVFIDSRVPDIQDLIDGVKPGDKVFVIDAGSDGLQQIADILAANHAQGLSGISIVSHGSVGEIEIGSTILNDSDIADHASALAAIGAALKPGGDLSLFACNAAQGAAGQQFIADLSSFAGGVDVAGSTHNIGSAAMGGSFLLDAATGAVDSAVPFTDSAIASFDGSLSGTITGQLLMGGIGTASDGFADNAIKYINSDGTSLSTVKGSFTNNIVAFATDPAAGLYFAVELSNTVNGAVTLHVGHLATGVDIQTLSLNPGDYAVGQGMTIDPINHAIYIGVWGDSTADTGIIKLTYNPTSGQLRNSSNTANISTIFNAGVIDSSFYINSEANPHGPTLITHPTDMYLDVANQKLYFVDQDQNGSNAPFGSPYADTNGVFVLNLATGAATLLHDFGTSSYDTQGVVALTADVAKGLIYVITDDQSGTSGPHPKLWYMPIAGGAPTQMVLPAGPNVTGFMTLDHTAGITLDPQAQQLYVSVAVDGTSANSSLIYKFQLSADGHTITGSSLTHFDNSDSSANASELSFNNIPQLSVTGTTTHAAEQGSAIALETAYTSSDSDGDHYASATAQITGGTFSANETSANDDHLFVLDGVTQRTSGTFTGTNITVSFNPATETLTLSGYDTIAHYNTVMAALDYFTTGDNPTDYGINGTRTVTWTVSDGSLNVPTGQQNSGTTVITLDAVNDASSLAGAGNTIAYTEQAAATAVANAITVSDADNLTQASATVTISNGLQSGDTLHFTNVPATMGNIAFTSFTGGVLTLTSSGATATLAQWQAALRSVTFDNSTNDDPTVGGTDTSRTITWVINDGTVNSASTTTTINITAVNDPPVVDLNGASAGTSATLSYTSTSAAATIAPAATVTDPDSANFNGGSFKVSLTANGSAADQLTIQNQGTGAGQIGVSGANVTFGGATIGTFSGGANGSDLVVTFTSTAATPAAVQALAEDIQFANNSATPSTLDRTATFTVVDGDGGTDTGTATATIHVAAPSHIAPVLSSAGSTVPYTEGDAATTLEPAIAASDSDSVTLVSATVQITNPVSGDELTINGTTSGTINNGVNGTITYSFAGGTLSLSGTDTVADYKTALELVKYDSTSDNPTAGGTNVQRTVDWTADDGAATNHVSNTVTTTIDVTAVNDPPVATVPGAPYAATEQTDLSLKNTGLSVADPDGGSGSETVTLSVSEGILTIGVGTSGVTIDSGNGSSSVTFHGTIAQINDLLNTNAASTVVYNDNTDTPSASATLTLAVNDQGNTGTGGPLSGSNSVTVNITAVDDPAVAANDAFTIAANAILGSGQNLFNDNGSGPDHDPDGPAITVASVNGSGANVGNQITLASGAHLTVNSDGTFSYDPNHAFDNLAASGSGAADTTATDSFTYTVDGGSSATVTVTVNGVDSSHTVYDGTGGNDTITGGNSGNFFDLSQGGNDTATGGSGNDTFVMGAAYTPSDHINGGGGTNNQLGLQGDYSGGVTLSGSSISNIQVLALLPGFNYTLTTTDDLVPAGQTFTFWSVTMASANHVTIDGSAETDGNFRFFLGQGNDTAIGGAGNDLFYGESGADTLTGGGGADTFAYLQVSDSTGTNGVRTYDDITDFTAGTDKFKLFGTAVTGIDTTVASGSLSTATFNTDLATDIGAAQLLAHHAVVFTPNAGTLAAHTFLVVDANGVAGYQAGADFVFDVTGGNLTGLATSDFT